VNETETEREFRLKSGAAILGYIRRFSATEKVLFGLFLVVAALSALRMAWLAADHFMTEIPAHGGRLREGLIGLPHTVNPVLAVTDVDRDISALVYSGLMREDNGKLVPDLASSYEVSADGLDYTFTLRPDLRFQDGQELTADDVAFTIQKIQDPALRSPRRSDWADVTATVLGPDKIRFSLKEPYASFLGNTTVGVLPKEIWGTMSDDQFGLNERNIEPIGSGPYKETSISRTAGVPTEYILSTWDGYYGTKPFISDVDFVFEADQDKALEALRGGTIDSLASVPPAAASAFAGEGNDAFRVVSSPLPRVFGVFFNQSQNAALADKAVRQALDLTVDRADLVSSVLYGFGRAIDGPLPDLSSPATTAPDIESARKILEKAGWKRNAASGVYEKKGAKGTVSLTFDIYTADTPDLKATADKIAASWTALGAAVSVKVFDSSDLYQNIIRTRKYDALLFGELIGQTGDLYAFWHSSQRNAPGLNVAMYANPKADKILESLQSGRSGPGDLTGFGGLIADDLPAVFLYTPDFVYAIPKSLKAVSLGSMASPQDRWNSEPAWYLQTQKVWNLFANN